MAASWSGLRAAADSLLIGIEHFLREERVGSRKTDRTLRNLLDMARQEATIVGQILEGGE